MTPIAVNAYYSPSNNLFAIPFGIADTPFYAQDVPLYAVAVATLCLRLMSTCERGLSYCKAVLLTAWPAGQFAPIPMAPLELFERPSIVALRDLSSIYIYIYILIYQ